MELVKNYWRQRRGVILVYIVFVTVFGITFFLYDISLKAVLYPAAICVVLGLIVLFLDVRAVAARHRKLKEISELSSALMKNFPDVKSQDDADYQEIISALRMEQNEIQTENAVRYRDMTDYYTIWAHQIKTPIASMRLILQNEDSALSRQLSDELQRIEQYVEMVLAFLRLDSSATDYVFREQELDDIIKESVKKFAGQFIRKKIKLYYEPIRMRVLTDEKWLSFVIEQVLSNAIKYTNSGSITIEAENDETLCIRDTGIGIAPEDIPRVFEKSYTGYNGRSDKKASGIGLYLCKRICDNLGHRITINSSLDSGTTVRIYLGHQKLTVE